MRSLLSTNDVRFGSRLCENPIDAMIPLLNRGGMMKGFVQGADRQQTTLLPECLDDWVDESNPVRAVDVFVDALELRDLGFDGVDPAATGRPAYHPSPMLKLYIYGYLNRVQSSRRLEREAGRNLEVMWLTGRLVPEPAPQKRKSLGFMSTPNLPLTTGSLRAHVSRTAEGLRKAVRKSAMHPMMQPATKILLAQLSVLDDLRAAVRRWHEIARGTRERKQLAEKRSR